MKYTVLTIRNTLLNKRVRTFTARELASLFSMSPRKSLYYLEHGLQTGLFTKLKRGMYSLKTDPPTEQEIANQLCRPSYLSYEYALAYYNILPEMVYTVTSATTKSTRLFVVGEKTYSYTSIKAVAYTGYELKMVNDQRFLIAEPEKALVDYLYLVALGRRQVNDRLDIRRLDTKKVRTYAKLFNRKNLLTLVEATIKQKTP
jgi:predicted transcriptional regulator of viral defense system